MRQPCWRMWLQVTGVDPQSPSSHVAIPVWHRGPPWNLFRSLCALPSSQGQGGTSLSDELFLIPWWRKGQEWHPQHPWCPVICFSTCGRWSFPFYRHEDWGFQNTTVCSIPWTRQERTEMWTKVWMTLLCSVNPVCSQICRILTCILNTTFVCMWCICVCTCLCMKMYVLARAWWWVASLLVLCLIFWIGVSH